MLGERGGTRSVGSVYVESRQHVSIHSDAADSADLGQRKDVGDGVWVIPDVSETCYRSHLVCDLLPASVRFQVKGFVHIPDVGQQVGVSENGDRRIAVQQYVLVWDPLRKVVFNLREADSDLQETAAVSSSSSTSARGIPAASPVSGRCGISSSLASMAAVPVVARGRFLRPVVQQELVGVGQGGWPLVAALAETVR